MEALWLKSQGLPHGQIAQLVKITENTLRDYCQLSHAGGVARLKEVAIPGPESALQEPHASVEAYFRGHPPATIKEAQSKIEAPTRIKRRETQVREYLKKLPLRCRRVGMLPAKANPEQQAQFLVEELEPR